MVQTVLQPDGTTKLRRNWHAGQAEAWRSDKRFVVVLAGTQGGKTSWAPHWLHREIKLRGPGDYLVATPTFPLLELKALPEFRRLFETQLRLGRYVGSPSRRFIFSEDGCIRTFGSYDPATPTQIFFGHAQDPDSLESATAKAAWLDEAGQKKFRLGSFEAILRRLSLAMGRVLITTTPYDLGWIKQRLHDPWQRARRDGSDHPEIDIIRFKSIANPAFPVEEYERARRDLPAWKFDLFYDAVFTRPAGMIYDCFDSEQHTCKRFAIPDDWPRYLGMDFGPVHMAALHVAAKPNTRKLYVYREYLEGRITTRQHVAALLKDEPATPQAYGGSASEGEWRSEFLFAGLPIGEPSVSDVEVGINRMYGTIRRDELIIFDDLPRTLAEVGSYSRELDDEGNPTDKIEDKASYHLLDAGRYILSTLRDAPASGAARVRPVQFGGSRDPKPQVPGDSRAKLRPRPQSVSNWDMLERTIKDEKQGRVVSWH